ncbi:GNAT family N-acetyltransferase [Vibrio tapetis]|uniref:Histone acetyltransferase n=1 Tax=Vibrio tapetis subsp. tapetis TaxID=1671868 RepID=A0A2N8ZLT8_9VIBR|nr:GNAT family N-acetyltransferase [Vibrio tapetis]SON52869.1 Histone acetyltransferase [Vibrio tapetis subsp. tapetis]
MSTQLEFRTVAQDEWLQLFTVVKAGLYHHVDAVFGWDDDFQKQRLIDDYQPEWFFWVYQDGVKVGLVCYKPYEDAFHVHLLIILKEHQGKAIGGRVMAKIETQAHAENKKRITLSSFRRNRGAIKFYQNLGYQRVNDEADFVTLSLSVS